MFVCVCVAQHVSPIAVSDCVCCSCGPTQLDNLEFDGEEISGLARCPFDAKQTNVALFAGKKHTHTAKLTNTRLP